MRCKNYQTKVKQKKLGKYRTSEIARPIRVLMVNYFSTQLFSILCRFFVFPPFSKTLPAQIMGLCRISLPTGGSIKCEDLKIFWVWILFKRKTQKQLSNSSFIEASCKIINLKIPKFRTSSRKLTKAYLNYLKKVKMRKQGMTTFYKKIHTINR